MDKKKLKKKILISLCLGVVFTAVSYYILLPAINIHDVGFWFYLAAVIFSFAVPFMFNGGDSKVVYDNQKVKIINFGGKRSSKKASASSP